MGDYKSWVNELGDSYLVSPRLEDNGATLTLKDAEIITNGPFLEATKVESIAFA
jgi:hypothetical protein